MGATTVRPFHPAYSLCALGPTRVLCEYLAASGSKRPGPSYSKAVRPNESMPDRLTLHRLFVAAPSDVADERQIVHQVIADWNAVHARSARLAFEPVSWLSHAVPEDGAPPQDILNRQIVRSSDILVGISWTRLGTPTRDAESGTLEEIDVFRAAGKPVALFFSDAPTNPDAIDDEQLQRLRAFRASAFAAGLCTRYRSYDEFRRQFTRYLGTLGRDLAEHVEVPGPIRQYIVAFPDFGLRSDLASNRVRTSQSSFYTALQCVIAALKPDETVLSCDSINIARASGVTYWVTEGLQYLRLTHEATGRNVKFVRVFIVRGREFDEHPTVLADLCELHNLAGATTMVARAEDLPAECLYEAVLFGTSFRRSDIRSSW